jgi:hypothetical protein
MSTSLLPTPTSLLPQYPEEPPLFDYEPAPDYSQQLLADELLLEIGAASAPDSQAPSSSASSTSYIYTSSHLTLNLGPRCPGQTLVPAYGRRSTLKGTINVDCSLKHVDTLEMVVGITLNLSSINKC